MIFRSKNTYSPNARNSFNTYKHITKLRTIKSKTIYNMTHILKTDLVFFHLLICYHQKHFCLTNNVSNSSTPGFKAMKLQDHLHYTDFKMNHYSKQI